MIRKCSNCKRLGATIKHNEYGSVFNWCSEKCFQEYVNKCTCTPFVMGIIARCPIHSIHKLETVEVEK